MSEVRRKKQSWIFRKKTNRGIFTAMIVEDF